jgi:hypothetical protein
MKIHGGLIECFFSIVGGHSTATTTTSQNGSVITTTEVDNSYSDQQHQIWVVGSSPTITNQNLPLPATWHVIGSGHKNDPITSITKTQSSGAIQTHRQTDVWQWYREKSVAPQRLAHPEPAGVGQSEPLQVRLSGNMIVVTSATGGIVDHDAITGWQQQTIDGVPQGRPTRWTGDASPLSFPTIQSVAKFQWDSAGPSP